MFFPSLGILVSGDEFYISTNTKLPCIFLAAWNMFLGLATDYLNIPNAPNDCTQSNV